eukprot:scaffold7461_cov417-Prasinococcus_capsulatus_cf.AAC.4
MGTKSRAENFKFTKKKLMNKYIPPDECVPEFTALLDCINLAGGSKVGLRHRNSAPADGQASEGINVCMCSGQVKVWKAPGELGRVLFLLQQGKRAGLPCSIMCVTSGLPCMTPLLTRSALLLTAEKGEPTADAHQLLP